MWIEKLTGPLEDKRAYRAYKARLKALPADYRDAAHALEHYITYFGPTDDGALYVSMLGDLAQLLEESAATGTALRDLLGEEPVEFADTFIASYEGGSWITKERAKLTASIARAAEKGAR